VRDRKLFLVPRVVSQIRRDDVDHLATRLGVDSTGGTFWSFQVIIITRTRRAPFVGATGGGVDGRALENQACSGFLTARG